MYVCTYVYPVKHLRPNPPSWPLFSPLTYCSYVHMYTCVHVFYPFHSRSAGPWPNHLHEPISLLLQIKWKCMTAMWMTWPSRWGVACEHIGRADVCLRTCMCAYIYSINVHRVGVLSYCIRCKHEYRHTWTHVMGTHELTLRAHTHTWTHTVTLLNFFALCPVSLCTLFTTGLSSTGHLLSVCLSAHTVYTCLSVCL